MSNPFHTLKDFGTKLYKDTPPHSKVGLGLGAVGLSLSVRNYLNNKAMADTSQHRASVESQSLKALKDIHEVLVTRKVV